MPQFPQRDLTNQYISTSYQDVVQRYASGSNSFLLDGLGYSILAIPTSSLGGIVLTQDQTASWAVSASWAPGTGGGSSLSSSWASASISSSFSQTASYAFTSSYELEYEISTSWASSSYWSTSSSFASRSLVSVSASWASESFHSKTTDVSISSSYTLYSELSNTASVAITAEFADTSSIAGYAFVAGVSVSSSWASQSLSASWAPGGGNSVSSSWASASFVATSASYASASTLALIADFALLADTASVADTSSFSYRSNVATSASWASESISASYVPNLYPQVEQISASWASASFSSSWAPQQQDITVNSITASYISASNIQTVDPVNAQDVATKQYVDNLTSFGVQYYFRSSSSDVGDYRNMYDINVPFLTASVDITVNNVSASQEFVSFISPEINITNIREGLLHIRYRLYRVGGAASNTVRPLLYIRSGSVDNFIESGSISSITTTTTDVFDSTVPLTSSLTTNSTDRLVVKFLAISAINTPNYHFTVEGVTGTGIIVPISSANFVLKTGDIMTGNLTAPGITSSLFGTASWAESASWAPNLYPQTEQVSASWASASLVSISASWASQSISTSYSVTASSLEGWNFNNQTSSVGTGSNVIISVSTGSYIAAFFDYAVTSGSNIRAGTIFGSWVNNSITFAETSNTDIGNTSQVSMSMTLSTGQVNLIATVSSTIPWNIRALGRYL